MLIWTFSTWVNRLFTESRSLLFLRAGKKDSKTGDFVSNLKKTVPGLGKPCS